MAAYLQSGNIDRILLLLMPAKNPPPPPETEPGEIAMATGFIYGTRDTGLQRYLYARKVFREQGWSRSSSRRGYYILLLRRAGPRRRDQFARR